MTPDDLIDLAVYNGLHFEASSQAGVVFHLMGALSRYGKLGLVAIGEDLVTADQIYRETLRFSTGRQAPPPPAGPTRSETQCLIAAELGARC